MWAIFKRELQSNGLLILSWGIGLGLLGYFMVQIYEAFVEQNIDLVQIMEVMPPEMMAFFGEGDFATPEGFLTVEFFSYIPVILGIVMIWQAGSLMSGKVEDGTLELVLAQPVSRSAVFWSRLLALWISLLLILAITWVGFVIGAAVTEAFEMSYLALVNPFISLLAVVLLFMGLSLWLSMILPGSKTASLVAVFILISSYFITSLARIEDRLAGLDKFSPLHYYQTGEALQGLNLDYLLILLVPGLLFFLLAWFFFVKKDFHFGSTSSLRIALQKNQNLD